MIKHRKFITAIMSIILVTACLPSVNVFASISEACGDNAAYTLDNNSILTASGTDSMVKRNISALEENGFITNEGFVNSAYSFVADTDAASEGYAAGEVIYSDSNIEAAAEQALTKEIIGETVIGEYSYTYAVKSSGVNTSVYVDDLEAKNWRIHSSYTALSDCTVIIAVRISENKGLALASLESSGIYKSLLYTDETMDESAGLDGTVLIFTLTAGETVYLIGQETDPEVFAFNAAVGGSDSPYSFVADKARDSDGDGLFDDGETVYSDEYITYSAVFYLGNAEYAGMVSTKIGSCSYTNFLMGSAFYSDIVLDGESKSMKIHSSVTAKQDCIVTIVTTVPSGKEVDVAEMNSDGTYTTLISYEGITFYGVEIVLKLSEGQTVYIMGQDASPYVYAVDAIPVGDADGNHITDLTDAVKIMQHVSGSVSLTEREFAAADINCDEAADREDAALVLKRLVSAEM